VKVPHRRAPHRQAALYQGSNMSDTHSFLIYVDHDDPVVEQTLLEFLTDLGHSATRCGSFDEVQTKLETSDPKPQMVITNVITRDLEAMELLRETHEQHPTVAMALITNGGRNLSATEAASCGVYAFLREPLRLSELEIYLTRL
jgi:DNA-binding NtrC family response regulator